MQKAIIVDIDGTVADRNGRHIHDYASVRNDMPHEVIIDLIAAYGGARPETKILFVTGRPKSCYSDTADWLYDNFLVFDKLIMRETGDYRKDYIVKKELYEAFIKDQYDVQFVLEDRQQVVDMWRAEGLRVLQVAEGKF